MAKQAVVNPSNPRMPKRARRFAAAAAMGLVFALISPASAQLAGGRKSGPSEPVERTEQRRAVEALMWLAPIVSVDTLRQAYFRDAGAKYGDIVWWSSTDWKRQTLMPPPATGYVYFNFNTKTGPVVVDLPAATGAGLFGTLFDAWQSRLIDVGPEGKDQGRGGKYLLLPPGYKHDVPAGYIPVRSQTYNGYAFIRAIPTTSSQADIGKAVALGKKLRLYPLALAGNPPEPRFIDMAGRLFDATVRFDESFLASLARMVNEEPVQTHDPALMTLLRSLGVEKGRQVKLDSQMQAALTPALGETKAQLRQAFADGLEVFWPGSRWGLHALAGAGTSSILDAPGEPGGEARRLRSVIADTPRAKQGEAPFHLLSLRDLQDQPLQGTNTYRLRVPANVPVGQFWALAVYDRETRAFIRASPRLGLASEEKLQTNADGTVDVYFGPTAPAGQESNWIYTAPNREWFAIFRFYGPGKSLFDKTWRLPDIEWVETSAAAAGDLKTPVADPHGFIGTETVQTRFGEFEFRGGYPTPAATDRLYDLHTFQRAVEAYLAHIPAVSLDHMRKGLNDHGVSAANTLAISETLIDARGLFLTANTETIYGTSFLDLERDGPVVVEAPPMLDGDALDMWMRNITAIGATGPDQGRGGKFLFLPAASGADVPSGYFVVRSPTFGVGLTLRGFLVDGKPDQAVARLKSVKIYPLATVANPPALRFSNLSGKAIDTIFPDTFAFFASLAAIVAREPVDAVPPPERFLLASIGIEKGKPFSPDAKSKTLLTEAARVGAALARAYTFASRDPEAQVYPDRHWERAFLGGSSTWNAKGYINSDQRAAWSYLATGNSPAMVDKVVGARSQDLWTPRDASGAYLDGGKSYRLRLPANVPAKLFWSIIVYDARSRFELQNGEPFPGISSYSGPTLNADGSFDIYFGPQVPIGKPKNWIKTVPGKGWFAWLRLYGPTQAFFDKVWRPGDIEEMISADVGSRALQ
jgi:hypothetical protein